jgi:YHS domain-containing protein
MRARALSVLADIVDRRNKRRRRLAPSGAGAQSLQAEPDPDNMGDLEQPIFATDPVCGMAVEIAGARYRAGGVYFCGPGCLETYEAEPSRYAEVHSSD